MVRLVELVKGRGHGAENRGVGGRAVRLNRFLAMAGVAARRKADALIRDGKVTVNGEVVTELGTQIATERDAVAVAGRVVRLPEEFLYILVNKPKQCLSSVSDERGRRVVTDLVKVKERVYPVGRLDYDTEGLLLLTNDGELAHRLTHPRFGIERIYEVWVEGSFTEADLKALRDGVALSDGAAIPTRVNIISHLPGATVLELALKEGRKREVKRMLNEVGHRVRRLRRVAFANLRLGGLGEGSYRFLSEEEVSGLKGAAGVED